MTASWPDITQVQGEITRDLSSRLKIQVSSAQQQKLGQAGTSNPEAYRLYLEEAANSGTDARRPEEKHRPLPASVANAADPNYALAYVGLADTYNVAPSYGIGISPNKDKPW